MVGPTTLLVLRIFHVVAGVFWVGGVLFVAGFLVPSVRAIGPASGPMMQQLTQVRRLPLWLMAATIIGLLSGFTLYWHNSAGFSSAWLGSGPGRVFGLGGAIGLLAAVLGMTINSPTAKRLGAAAAALQGAGRPPTAGELAEIHQLQARLARWSVIGAVLLVLATVAMAVARYIP